MSVYKLRFDEEFISPSVCGEYLYVTNFVGSFGGNTVKIIRTTALSDEECHSDANRVHARLPAAQAQTYNALQVYDDKVEGENLREVLKDLKALEKGRLTVFVNRLGHCMIMEVSPLSFKNMWTYDRFLWSKYGVKLPRGISLWNGYDESYGETHVAGARQGTGNEKLEEEEKKELRRKLEEKDVELAACKKELEEKGLELERSKNRELVLSWLVEEKKKEVKMAKDQFLAFKATLRSMVDQ
ncbi:unnamed protein product [Linum trigynum]|uniref:Uncharacterized protein n=1 Tax=Linum trigynum TaxID=586398 RepID=A0AAV2FIZ6_9ROSI